MTEALWSALVSTALVGTGRRAVPEPRPGTSLARAAAALPAADDPAHLLDLAALTVSHLRAGHRPGRGVPAGPPCRHDARPSVPRRAAVRLRVMLRGLTPGDRGVLYPELLPEWLSLARDFGYRAPEAELPALLTAARLRVELRDDTAALAGSRGRWLASLNPEWSWLTHIEADDPDADPEDVWQHGTVGERAAALGGLRARDPAAARALLCGTWLQERAEDRARFTGLLRTGLGPGDEALLEAALDDRAHAVRAAAAALLVVLPESAYARRMTARAANCLQPDGDWGVAVTPPTGYDGSMLRDGIAEHSPTGRAPQAWWLGEIVAATHLARWPRLFGDPDASAVVARELPADWAEDVRDGWARAAAAQGDAGWARALLAKAGAAGATRLLAVLDAPERAARAAGHVVAHGLPDAFQILAGCDVPWPPVLADAVLEALAEAGRQAGYPWSFSGVTGLAARSLPPELAARADGLAQAAGEGPWREAFVDLAATLRLRTRMREELAQPG